MPSLPESISYTDLGSDKTDYSNPVNSSTDRMAAEINTAFVNTAMMTRTANRGWIRFQTDGSGNPSLVSSASWNTVWRANTSAQPVLVKTGTGVMTATFPVSVTDEQSNSHTTNIQLVHGGLEGTVVGFINCSASANVITIRTFNVAGSAADLLSTNINVVFI